MNQYGTSSQISITIKNYAYDIISCIIKKLSNRVLHIIVINSIVLIYIKPLKTNTMHIHIIYTMQLVRKRVLSI